MEMLTSVLPDSCHISRRFVTNSRPLWPGLPFQSQVSRADPSTLSVMKQDKEGSMSKRMSLNCQITGSSSSSNRLLKKAIIHQLLQSMSINYYQVLELGKKASNEEVKQSYKRLALKYHPDKNTDKETSKRAFTQISEAYTVLSDPDKRDNYDKYGTADMDGVNIDFESFFAASFDDFETFLQETLFTNFTGNLNKLVSGFGKGNSKRSKRAKGATGGSTGDFEKLLFSMMGMGGMSFPEEKPSKNKKGEDQDWETDSEDQQNPDDYQSDQDSEEQFTDMQLMLLPVYIQQNSTSLKKNKKNSTRCDLDGQILKGDETLVQHFCDNHQQQFREWIKKR